MIRCLHTKFIGVIDFNETNNTFYLDTICNRKSALKFSFKEYNNIINKTNNNVHLTTDVAGDEIPLCKNLNFYPWNIINIIPHLRNKKLNQFNNKTIWNAETFGKIKDIDNYFHNALAAYFLHKIMPTKPYSHFGYSIMNSNRVLVCEYLYLLQLNTYFVLCKGSL